MKDDAALSALLLTTRLQPGDRVLVDEAAWGGAIAMLGGFDGVEVDRLPSTTSGAVDLDQVRASIRSRTVLVLTSWCAATRGTLNPVREMGTIFSEAGIPYIVDACQVVGQRPVDVTEIKCSALFASGRKWLRGPRGTAILYVAREFLAATRPQLLDQFGASRTDARRYERGEFNVAGQIGLGAAIKEALETDLSRIACRTEMLAIRLREGLRETRGLHLLDAAGGSGPIVGFYSQEMPTEKLAATLRQGGVTVNLVSTSYAPLSAEAARTDFVIRAAPQVYNKLEEVDLMIEIVQQSAVSRCM